MRRVELSDLIPAERIRGGVLALDLSSAVGWALARADAVTAWPCDRPGGGGLVPSSPRPHVEYGTQKLGALKSQGHRFAVLDEALKGWLTAANPGVIVLEEALPSHRSRNQSANELSLGLRAIVHAAAHRSGAIVYECNVVSVKAWLTGKTHAKKPEMMAAVTALGWPVATDHEADALAILDLTLCRHASAARVFGNRRAA